MARRVIKAPRRRQGREPAVLGTLTQAEVWDLQLGMDGGFASEAERRAAWLRWRDELIAGVNLGTRPEAFWDYEPGVPAELRHGALDALARAYRPPSPHLSLVAAQEWRRDPCAARIWADGELDGHRRTWLLEHPEHLRPGEATVLEADVARLERERLEDGDPQLGPAA